MDPSTVILCVIFILIIVLGLFGNMITILVFTKTERLLGYRYYGDIGCIVMATVFVLSCGTSVISLSSLALSQYVIIVQTKFKHMLKWKFTISLVACSWLYVGTFFALTFTKHARITYYPNMHGCLVDYAFNVNYSACLFFLIFMPQTIFTVLLYWKIYQKFRTSRSQVRAHVSDDSQISRSQEKDEFYFALQLFIIFVMFQASQTPIVTVVFFIDPNGTRLSGTVYLILEILSMVNSAANPLLYCVFHRVFNKEVRKLFCLVVSDDSLSLQSSSYSGRGRNTSK